mmetsp:Transcript_80293/g.130116  ORF Transcript_80293/g.130116 Transcript_80293/m.130116 type:complete len:264 (-) Transcript_80293:906-1697(-)
MVSSAASPPQTYAYFHTQTNHTQTHKFVPPPPTPAHIVPSRLSTLVCLQEVHKVEPPTKTGILHWPHSRMRHCSKRCEFWLKRGIEMNKSALIAHLIAVVGRRKDRDCFTSMLHFVALILAFVTSDQELEAVVFEKAFCDILPEGHSDAPFRGHQPHVWSRVAPEHFSHGTLVRGLLMAIDLAQIVEACFGLAKQPSMQYQHLATDNMSERQPLKDIRKERHHLSAILRCHLALESIHAVHVDSLVVATVEMEVLRVQALVGK